MGHPIHHLEVICLGCEVRVRVNDLPIVRLVAPGPDAEWFAPPVNPYLMGQDNILQIEIDQLLEPDGTPRDLRSARIELAVRRFDKGEPVAPGVGQALIDLALHDELAQRFREGEAANEELELPYLTFHLFDNEGPSFAAELRDADPYEDENALRDYAIHLRDLARARDAAGLVGEMEPKIQAYMAAYDEPREPFADSIGSGLRDEFLPAGVQTDFESDDVELEPCCGGRIWALKRRGGAPLLQTAPDRDGNTMQFEILVAPRDGALKIVR